MSIPSSQHPFFPLCLSLEVAGTKEKTQLYHQPEKLSEAGDIDGFF